jgi:hypothetical protein
MKLTSAQVERTLTQFEAHVLPDTHPVVPRLNELFGDHTFFVASNGLNVVEPTDSAQSGAASGKVVNVANWGDANLTSLVPHDPEPTDVVIELGPKH